MNEPRDEINNTFNNIEELIDIKQSISEDSLCSTDSLVISKKPKRNKSELNDQKKIKEHNKK